MVPQGADSETRRRRPRLRLIYFSLAAFDLLTVSLSLYLIDRIMDIYTASVQVNRRWAGRLGDYSELSKLAADVNAPGNDVFETGDVPGESQRLRQAVDAFDDKFQAVRAELRQHADQAEVQVLEPLCDKIDAAVRQMIQEAEGIFVHFRAQRSELAGQRMAAMDRQYAAASRALADLGTRVHAIQQRHLDRQAVAAASLRKYEYLIAGSILLMVVGVTIYGHKLASQMKLSEQQNAEHFRALAASQSQLQNVLDNTPAVVYVKDCHSRYQMVNRRFKELFGDSRRVVGRTVHDLFPREVADQLVAHDQEVVQRATALSFEERIPCDGGWQTYLSVKFPLHDQDGRITAVCGISTDITARKQAEEELGRHRDRLEELVTARTAELEASHERLRLSERLASIGTLAAGLGHDMNNILFPVRCQLDALDVETLSPQVRAELTNVRHSLAYLQQLSDGLRLLSLDPEDSDEGTAVTELGDWWNEVQHLFQTALGRQARLEQQFDESLPAVAVARHRLTQAVFNLITNAGEAIGGEGLVRVAAEALDDRRFVRIAVTDNGCGMPARVRQQALDPFFTTKKRKMSTGLGLSLVHGLAKSVGGAVEIESTPGQGTTVTVTVPAAHDVPPLRGGDGQVARRAVITLEDDPRLGSLIAALLETANFEIRCGTLDGGDDVDLWVTRASQEALEPARRFLSAAAGRHVIALGEEILPWKQLGALTLQESDGIEEIQQAIRAVVLTEVSS